MAGKKFDGEGYATTPITKAEAAKHRHMFYELQEKWEMIENGVTIARGAKLAGTVIKVCAPLFLFFTAGGIALKLYGITG